MTRSAHPLPRECRAFLRSLPDAVAASARGTVPEHPAACAFCGSRLAAATGLAAALRRRPEAPAVLRAPAFLEAVHERALEALEAGVLANALEHTPAPAPADLPWPEVGPTGRRLAEAAPPQPAPELLWARVRAEVRAEVARGRMRRLRRWQLATLGAVAAAVAVLALLLPDGTSPEPTIVFVDVLAMPAVDTAPLAVLRTGGMR